MGVKKVKISAVKRAHHLKSKKKVTKPTTKVKSAENLLKKGPQYPIKKSKKKEKPKNSRQRNVAAEESEDDEQIAENIRDIIDDDDLDYLQEINIKSRKRKYQEEESNEAQEFEDIYTKQTFKEKSEKKVIVDLLPIKSKAGEIITRTAELDYIPKKPGEDKVGEDEEDVEEEEVTEAEDSDEDILQDDRDPEKNEGVQKVISTADLLIRRQQEIEKQKYRIGIICSGILEKPEDKMKNFSALFELMEERSEAGVTNLLSVRKLACISIAEVFLDILPEYRVGQVDTKMTTVRKTTLERITYETALLQQFKKYLQKLEKITSCISKKGGHRTPQKVKMAEVAVGCLCDILSAHPYFNYVQNIAQLLVYMLNCRYQSVRERINKCFREIFVDDKKFDMTLFIIRRINHLIKSKSNNVFLEVITCLLALRIKNVNLDAEKENELKQKKLEAHRQRLLNLSKRERKRRKKLTELNKELQETKAEENKQSKHYKLTEIIKMVFTIYFRILKNDPNSKLLSACLEGLAEFAHVINLEFFSDLIEVLNNLLETGELGYREELHCIQTIFVILSGQGEVLNIDPIRFYGHLYKHLLVVNAGKNHEDSLIILRTLTDVLVKRRKNITQYRMLAFVKRILTLSLQLLHNGTLAGLGIVKTLMQLTSNLDILLDTDTTVGSGRFDPELDDPEYCNANCTSLYELATLIRHYHPTVRRIANHIANGVPASGEGSLPSEIGKLTSEELYKQFDSSQMAFNPPVPVPKVSEPKFKKGRHMYIDPTIKRFCKDSLRSNKGSREEIIDFYNCFSNILK